MAQVNNNNNNNPKVIQISPTFDFSGKIPMCSLVVLCDNGAILEYVPSATPPWKRFADVPSTALLDKLPLVASVAVPTEVVA